jgi:gliding motility-associated lipoprotein GldH
MFRIALIFIVSCFLSCSNTTHEEYKSFKNDTWHADSVLMFEYFIEDTTKVYKLDLTIRYTTNYKFQNLFLFLSESVVDTLDIKLKEKDGKPTGKGLTDIREITVNIADKKTYEKRGKYILNIEQAMRYGKHEVISNLQNIKDVGLIISSYE